MIVTPPPSTSINTGGAPASVWFTWFNTIYQTIKGEFSNRAGGLQQNVTYIPTNALITTYVLPTAFNVNDIFIIVGYGAGGWTITQNAGQTIHRSTGSTTTGIGGSVPSTSRYDCITLRGTVKNTDLVQETHEGNLTYV